VTLRGSRLLTAPTKPATKPAMVITAGKLTAQTDQDAQAEDGVELRYGELLLNADKLSYRVVEDLARAEGNVRIQHNGNLFTGPLLQKMELAPLFDAVVAGDEVAEKKPHPALLLEACRRLRLHPAEVTLIGDSVNDAQAARAAGCGCLLVETGYNEGEGVASLAGAPGLDAILPSLADAVQWVLQHRPARARDATTR